MKKKLGTSARNPLFLRDEELETALTLKLLSGFSMATTTQPLRELHNLNAGLANLLCLIHIHDVLPMSDLRSYLALPKQTLSNQVKDLVKRGFVETKSDGRDQRKSVLVLTADGKALALALLERQKSVVRVAFSKAGPDAVQGFLAVLEQIAAIAGPSANRRASLPGLPS